MLVEKAINFPFIEKWMKGRFEGWIHHEPSASGSLKRDSSIKYILWMLVLHRQLDIDIFALYTTAGVDNGESYIRNWQLSIGSNIFQQAKWEIVEVSAEACERSIDIDRVATPPDICPPPIYPPPPLTHAPPHQQALPLSNISLKFGQVISHGGQRGRIVETSMKNYNFANIMDFDISHFWIKSSLTCMHPAIDEIFFVPDRSTRTFL